jgi:hypothetical protein
MGYRVQVIVFFSCSIILEFYGVSSRGNLGMGGGGGGMSLLFFIIYYFGVWRLADSGLLGGWEVEFMCEVNGLIGL